jgi:hypothetical protein
MRTPCALAWAIARGILFGGTVLTVRDERKHTNEQINLGGTMVDAELLEILRCPYCVSGETRREDKEDPGVLDLVREESWLVCQDCDRKYPIRDDIPVMLIETGEKWMETPVEDLPVPPPEES